MSLKRREIKVGELRIDFDGELLLKTNLLVKAGRYKTRTDVVRGAVREMFEKVDWNEVNEIIDKLDKCDET